VWGGRLDLSRNHGEKYGADITCERGGDSRAGGRIPDKPQKRESIQKKMQKNGRGKGDWGGGDLKRQKITTHVRGRTDTRPTTNPRGSRHEVQAKRVTNERKLGKKHMGKKVKAASKWRSDGGTLFKGGVGE